MSNYGYVRVSSKDQCIDRQVKALNDVGVIDKNIYIDSQSGKNFTRPGYKKMLRQLQMGDVLFVKSIDRLGRSYDEIIEQWRLLYKIKGVDIVVLDMPLLDTRKKDGGITGSFLADMVLQILSYVADIERQFIKQRQAEGIAMAHKRGVKFGRPAKERPQNYISVANKYKQGLITSRKAADECGVAHSTFMYWIKN